MSGNDQVKSPLDVPVPAVTGGYQDHFPQPTGLPVCAPSAVKEGQNEDIPKDGSINFDYLNLSFEECFHEHESTKLYPQVYMVVGMVYQYTKLIIYHVFVMTIGLLMAFLWAIINGLMAFIHTWIYNPFLRVTLLWVWAVMPLITEPLKAIFKPLVDVSARIFSQIQVSTNFGGGVGWYTQGKAAQV